MRHYGFLLPWTVFVVSVALYLSVLPLASVEKPRHEQLFTLPPKIMRVMTFQFKEAVGDIAFLNALTYIGGLRTQPDTLRYLPEQYEWIFNTLHNSSTLDPYFLDPYYLMNSSLIWDRYKVDEVNTIIAKGTDTRDWDHLLAYFAGFNYYYYLNDEVKSIKYLKLASTRAGGNYFYDSLIAQVAYKANKTEIGIAYLEERIRQLDNEGRENTVEILKKRLAVLNGILQIEKSVVSYRQRFGTTPNRINDIIAKGLLQPAPPEATNGNYVLDPDGNVRSISDFKYK